jgi:hypothetical protein
MISARMRTQKKMVESKNRFGGEREFLGTKRTILEQRKIVDECESDRDERKSEISRGIEAIIEEPNKFHILSRTHDCSN